MLWLGNGFKCHKKYEKCPKKIQLNALKIWFNIKKFPKKLKLKFNKNTILYLKMIRKMKQTNSTDNSAIYNYNLDK